MLRNPSNLKCPGPSKCESYVNVEKKMKKRVKRLQIWYTGKQRIATI